MALKAMLHRSHVPVVDNTRGSSAESIQIVESVQSNEETDEKEIARGADVASVISYTEAEERKVVKKLDRWIMPILCVSYALQFWDKTLIAQAVLFGLARDLGLTSIIGYDADGNPITSSTRFSNVNWVFYLGYLFGAYPMTLLAQRFPTAKVISISILVWSIIVMSTAACKNYSELMVNRFFLGFFESCLAPSFIVYVSFWWTRHEQGLRNSMWFGALGVGMTLGPLFSYGLGHIHGDLGSSWKYIYLIAGAIPAIWSFVVLWVLPDDPHRAKWLSAEERCIVLSRLKAENTGSINRQFVAAEFWEALTSYSAWSTAFFLGGGGIPNGALSSFSGLVINGFGFDAFSSVLLMMPMGVIAFISAVGGGMVASRRVGWRYYIIAALYTPVLVGCLIDWLSPRHEKGLLYVGVLLLAALVGTAGLVNSQSTSNSAGHTKKTTVTSISFIGYCIGNIAGPIAFSSTPGPRYSGGFISSVAFLISLIALALFSRWYLGRENRRRDREFGVPSDELGLADVTDKENRNFRYIL